MRLAWKQESGTLVWCRQGGEGRCQTAHLRCCGTQRLLLCLPMRRPDEPPTHVLASLPTELIIRFVELLIDYSLVHLI